MNPVQIAQTREQAGFHIADIDKALDDLGENFDVSREDLDLLLSRAEIHAAERIGRPAWSLP